MLTPHFCSPFFPSEKLLTCSCNCLPCEILWIQNRVPAIYHKYANGLCFFPETPRCTFTKADVTSKEGLSCLPDSLWAARANLVSVMHNSAGVFALLLHTFFGKLIAKIHPVGA